MENTNAGIGLDGPKERILMAASEVFAEQGFANGTTREIARRAGANVAAINYHFGNKEQLYVSVLNYWKQRGLAKLPLDRMQDATVPPEERLKAFVRSLLEMMLDEKARLWFSKIITREVVLEPTGALSGFLGDDTRNVMRYLQEILQEICGEDADSEAVHFCAAGIVGQCFFFTSSQSALQSLFNTRVLSMENVDIYVEYIVRFALGAISGINNRV